jgi:hypothetical protein
MKILVIQLLTGADTRPRYDERNNRIDNTYVGVFLGYTSAGKAWNSSITVTKNFASDLVDANISATYATEIYGFARCYIFKKQFVE